MIPILATKLFIINAQIYLLQDEKKLLKKRNMDDKNATFIKKLDNSYKSNI